jgi:hypothetical protein
LEAIFFPFRFIAFSFGIVPLPLDLAHLCFQLAKFSLQVVDRGLLSQSGRWNAEQSH